MFNKHIEMRYFIDTILNGVAAYVYATRPIGLNRWLDFLITGLLTIVRPSVYRVCARARAAHTHTHTPARTQAVNHNLIVCISATQELIFIVMPGI